MVLDYCNLRVCSLVDFEVPLVISSDAATTDNFTVNEDAIAMLSSMGFTRDQAIKALKATVHIPLFGPQIPLFGCLPAFHLKCPAFLHNFCDDTIDNQWSQNNLFIATRA